MRIGHNIAAHIPTLGAKAAPLEPDYRHLRLKQYVSQFSSHLVSNYNHAILEGTRGVLGLILDVEILDPEQFL